MASSKVPQWTSIAQAESQNYPVRDKAGRTLLYMGMNTNQWTQCMLSLLDEDNRQMFHWQLQYVPPGDTSPACPICLFLIETVNQIEAMIKYIVDQGVDCKYVAADLFNGRRWVKRVRCLAIDRKSNVRFENDQMIAGQKLQHLQIPQHDFIQSLMNKRSQQPKHLNKQKQINEQCAMFDKWTPPKQPPTPFRDVRLNGWLEMHWPQMQIGPVLLCSEFIVLSFGFYAMQPARDDTTADPRCESHKSSSFNKSIPTLPDYIYRPDEFSSTEHLQTKPIILHHIKTRESVVKFLCNINQGYVYY